MKNSQIVLALLTLAFARPVLAWHVAGTVYCDKNGNGQIDSNDTKRSGVTIRATALDGQAGTTFSASTSSVGAYSVGVFDTPNRYTMAITAGLPAGAQVTIPTGGTGTAVLTNSITQIDNFNFLVANNCNAVPQCTNASQCSDGNACTTDTCQAGACVHTNNTATCDDGSACTVGDVCGGGTCHAGPAPNCNDGNLCTTDSCNPASGCVHAPNVDPCDDGTLCTTSDVCANGACAGTPVACDDGDACNGTEVCDPQTGACVIGSPAFLLRKGGRINNEATIQVGLGANDPRGAINMGHAVTMSDGTTVSADVVKLGAGTSVYNVQTNKLLLARGATVRNTTATVALPLTAPFCPIAAPFPACNPAAPINVGTSEVVGPLSPGVYGDVRVLRSGVLTLLPGDYVFCSLVTGTLADIKVTGPGQSTFAIAGVLQISDGSTFEPAPGAPLPVVENSGKLVRVGEQGRLFSVLSAPNALVKLGRAAEVHGSICADKVNTDKNTLFACP